MLHKKSLFGVILVLFWGGSTCAQLLRSTSKTQVDCNLNCPALTESSGVCVGKGAGDVVWTHNDSGAGPVLYGFSTSGVWLARVEIVGAESVDWEDICAFSVEGKPYLAIGDVGDNLKTRKSVQIYVVREPKIKNSSDSVQHLKLELESMFDVTYANGPVNCESLAYDPVKRFFVLPSKELLTSRLYEVDAKRLAGQQSVRAEHTQTIGLPMITAADITTDGSQLVVATYGPGGLFERHPTNRRWITEAAEAIFKLPARRQGEAICFAQDDNMLLVTSEFAPTPLKSVQNPRKKSVHNPSKRP